MPHSGCVPARALSALPRRACTWTEHYTTAITPMIETAPGLVEYPGRVVPTTAYGHRDHRAHGAALLGAPVPPLKRMCPWRYHDGTRSRAIVGRVHELAAWVMRLTSEPQCGPPMRWPTTTR